MGDAKSIVAAYLNNTARELKELSMSILRNFRKCLVGIAVLLVFPATAATAEKPVVWKVQSLFSTKMPVSGDSAITMAKNVASLTNDSFQLKVYKPGAFVPVIKCVDAVIEEKLDACWQTPLMHAREQPAMYFFGGVPFGMRDLGAFLSWSEFGEGREIRKEFYESKGITYLTTTCYGPETSGWFREPMPSIDALKGIKMRFFGLGAKVVSKLGVAVTFVPFNNLQTALTEGELDATEFSTLAVDNHVGFREIVKHNYFPGWHQGPSCLELVMKKSRYDALSDQHRAALEIAAKAAMNDGFGRSERLNAEGLVENETDYGVTTHRWTDDQLAQFERTWNEVRAEVAANDPFFRRVADSYYAWMATHQKWRDATELKPTYLK